MKFVTEVNAVEVAMAMIVGTLAILAVIRGFSRGADTAIMRMTVVKHKELLIPGAMLLLALLLSASEVTQFMTLDEAGFGTFLRDPQNRNIAYNWAQGASHTASLVWIPVTRVLQRFAASPATIDGTLKGVHWMMGIILIIVIVFNVLRLLRWAWTDGRWLAVALAGMLLLLPVSNLALKTLNYDAISLFGSVLAVLLIACGVVENSSRLLLLGLIVAALAAQEKLNASLVLLLLCLVTGVHHGVTARSRPVAAAALYTLKAMAVALIVSLVSYALAALSLAGDPAIHVLVKTLPLFMEPLSVWIYAPLRFLFGIGEGLADPAVRMWYAWGATALTLVLLPVAAALLVALRSVWLERFGRLSRYSFVAFPAGILVLLAAGTAGIWFVTPVFAPMVPLDPAVSIGVFNGVQLHFGAHGFIMHRLAALGFAYGVFLAALPTVVLVAAIATAISLLRRRTSLPFFDLMFGIAIVTPGFLALMGTPTFNRYLNIPILWAVIAIAVRSVEMWLPMIRARTWGWLVLPVMIGLMLLEVAPFRPLYAAFRPITVEYADSDRPVPGGLNFSWTGWGEEALLAGKLVDAECRKHGQLGGIDCGKIGIWSVYDGRWFPGRDTKVHQAGYGIPGEQAALGGADIYYVINRQLLAGGLIAAFPTIEPDFTLGYRGFAMAWVFRGDRLINAGYRFSPRQ